MFSQYIETRYAAELLADGAAGVGYLLKDRVADVSDFVEALVRVASGGTALDPEVVTQLLGASRRTDSISVLSAREREVLALMAEGRSNAAIADRPRGVRGRGREARRQHLHQARPAGVAVRPPPGPGRAAVPRLLTVRDDGVGHRRAAVSRSLKLSLSCSQNDRSDASLPSALTL